MPCYATGSAEGDARLAAKEANGKLTETTRLLCEACRLLEQNNIIDAASRKLIRWWIAHKKTDKERIERELQEKRREQVRKEALSKLSDEERRVLGL